MPFPIAAGIGVGRFLAAGGSEAGNSLALSNFAMAQAARAGKAEAKSIIGKAIEGITEAVSAVADKFGQLKSVILDTVKAFQPFAVIMFNRAILDLKATFGEIFLPILREATVMVRALADAVYNLPSGLKTFIRAITEIVLAISGVTAVTAGVIGAIAAVVTGLAALGFGIIVLVDLLALLAIPLTAAAIALAPLIVIFGAFTAGVIAITVAIVQLVRMMLRTEGGARLMKALGDMFQFVFDILGVGFSVIGEILDLLSPVLSDLADILVEVLTALKPIIALGIVPLLAMISVALISVTTGLRIFLNVLNLILKAVMMTPTGRALKAVGSLMGSDADKKSSYGLGWATARVDTDPNAIYNRITEELLRNTRTSGAAKDPNKQTAENTSKFTDLLVKALTKYLTETSSTLEKIGRFPVNFLMVD